ncbi:MAG: signal peptidase II [Thermaerobacter sp.]|nr:signal peptidase II [Thermaerobacter sp.]
MNIRAERSGERGYFTVVLVTVLVFVLDFFSKLFVMRTMFVGQSIVVIPHVFYVTYVQNPGAAFGLLANQTLLFVVATLLAVLAVVLLAPRHSGLGMRLSLGMFLGGALGNLVDHLWLGSVVDFLDFRIWPVFNVADVALVLGVFSLALQLTALPGRRQEKQEKGSTSG